MQELVKEILLKALVEVTIAAAPEVEVVAAACSQTPRKPWPKKGRSEDPKRRRSK